MARQNRSGRGVWDQDDFIDINSHSSGEPPQYDWFVNRQRQTSREPARAAPSRQGSGRREPARSDRRSGETRRPAGRGGQTQRRPPPDSRRPGGKRPSAAEKRPPPRSGRQPPGRPAPRAGERVPRSQEPRKRRKPMSKAKRRVLMVLGLLVMLGGTAFLAESLLFRVTGVRVTGDPVYPEEQIKTICNYKNGDNLLLIPTGEKERALQEQLPYIGRAKISRRIPGTVVINITAAQPACSMEAGGSWLAVAADGKVLESRAQPVEGILRVTGLSPGAVQPGKPVVLENREAAEAFAAIVEQIGQLNAAGDFTRLNMADLNDIRLWYQDRVECKLGSIAQLEYKVQTGYNLFQNEGDRGIGQDQTGVLDLSYSDTKTFYFTPGEVDPNAPAQPAPGAQPTQPEDRPPADGGDTGSSGGEGGTDPDGGASAPAGRGGDIPDQPYTG